MGKLPLAHPTSYGTRALHWNCSWAATAVPVASAQCRTGELPYAGLVLAPAPPAWHCSSTTACGSKACAAPRATGDARKCTLAISQTTAFAACVAQRVAPTNKLPSVYRSPLTAARPTGTRAHALHKCYCTAPMGQHCRSALLLLNAQRLLAFVAAALTLVAATPHSAVSVMAPKAPVHLGSGKLRIPGRLRVASAGGGVLLLPRVPMPHRRARTFPQPRAPAVREAVGQLPQDRRVVSVHPDWQPRTPRPLGGSLPLLPQLLDGHVLVAVLLHDLQAQEGGNTARGSQMVQWQACGSAGTRHAVARVGVSREGPGTDSAPSCHGELFPRPRITHCHTGTVLR